MHKPLGVVIVSFNTRDILRRCLQALAASRGVSLRVVVVDNGSSDGSVAMVANEFPDVQLLRNTLNNGFGAATNQGVQLFLRPLNDRCKKDGTIAANQSEMLRPDYIVLLNSDAFVEPDTLACLLAYAYADATAGVIAPQLRNADGSLQPTGR